jgi:hypothetical protein
LPRALCFLREKKNVSKHIDDLFLFSD